MLLDSYFVINIERLHFPFHQSIGEYHCEKSVRIWSYSGPYFPAFGLNMDQDNAEYEHFLRCGLWILFMELFSALPQKHLPLKWLLAILHRLFICFVNLSLSSM